MATKTNLAEAAKAIQARKAPQPERTPKPKLVKPTSEREGKNETQSAGMATRITPPIETMHKRGQIDDEEFAILKRYSLAAITAYGSETRSCCDASIRGGSGEGPSAAVTHARIIASQLENRAGAHVSLVRAVCRGDKTLTEWCIDKWGGRERVKNGKTVIRPVGENRVRDALAELKIAARWMRG